MDHGDKEQATVNHSDRQRDRQIEREGKMQIYMDV